MASEIWDEIIYASQNLMGRTAEVWGWILSKLIPRFIMDVISYRCNFLYSRLGFVRLSDRDSALSTSVCKYLDCEINTLSALNDSGVGVTKPISSVPLFFHIFFIVKTHFFR